MRAWKSVALAGLWCAYAALAAAPASAASADAARSFVDGVASKALAAIGDTKGSKQQKQGRLERIFASSVDIPWVGRFTLGQAWRQASESQRSRYLRAYESFWVKHYASRFADYTGGEYKITGAEADEDTPGQFTVSMTMTSAEDHKDVQVEYRVHSAGGGLKIFDVVVEGVSMINTQRSEFASVVSRDGLDSLIKQLESRTLEVNQ